MAVVASRTADGLTKAQTAWEYNAREIHVHKGRPIALKHAHYQVPWVRDWWLEATILPATHTSLYNTLNHVEFRGDEH